jgi:diacylglycerol kinase family enzyme
MAVVANTRLFALFPLTPQANATDGHLDVIIFHGVGWWAKLRHLASVLLLQHQRAPNVERARIRWIEFRSRPPLPIELDGEPWGQTPMRFEVVPNGATIWVPASAPDDLFGRTTGPQAAVSPAID